MAQSESLNSVVTALNSTLEQPGSRPSQRTSLWTITTVVLILMIITAVFGNIMVLTATWRDKRLHQPNKYFIACLAVADLTVGLFSIPIRLYLHIHDTDLVEVELCRFWNWIDISGEVASIITLTIISIDRYLKISLFVKYKLLVTTSRSIVLICLIWLISILHGTLGVLSYGGSRGVFVIASKGCSYDNAIYLTVTASIFFFVPMFVMIVMYTLIFHIAQKRRKIARKGCLGESFRATGDMNMGGEFLQELKTLRMLFLIVATFILCWGPFFIIFLLNTYKSNYVDMSLSEKGRQIVLTIFIVILPSFNSLCNPIIYACLDRGYGKAFKHLFQGILCCQNSQGEMTAKSSKSSTTQNLRLRELRNSRINKSLSAPGGNEENCPAKTSLV